MTSAAALENTDDTVISEYLLNRYGLLLGRKALAEVLKFPSPDAFDRHFQRGYLDLPVLRFAGRRGVFVLATDVARYLVSNSAPVGKLTKERNES